MLASHRYSPCTSWCGLTIDSIAHGSYTIYGLTNCPFECSVMSRRGRRVVNELLHWGAPVSRQIACGSCYLFIYNTDE